MAQWLRLRVASSRLTGEWRYCVVSLSKSLYHLLGTQVQFRKTGNCLDMTEKLLTGA